MIIDLPLHVEQMIVHEAQKQGVSVAELITQKFKSDDKKTLTLNGGVVQTSAIGLGDRIHHIFAQADYLDLEIPERTGYPREIEL